MICTYCGTNCMCKEDMSYECPNCDIVYQQAELEFKELVELSVHNTPIPNALTQREEDDPMRSIQVTTTNIKFVSIDWLCVRYNKLRKQSLTSDVEREMLLIEEHLKSQGKAELVGVFDSAEQLEMDIPVVMKEQYVPIVEELLKEHSHLQNRKNWLENCIPVAKVKSQPDIPNMVAGYGNVTGVTGGGEFRSSVEQSVIRSMERVERMEAELHEIESKMHPMEKALQELYPDQLQVIESKYFPREEPKDEYLISKFTWSRTRYYEVKKAALIRLACSLKII